ncbi:MAG: D-glycerate dehydrogenase [Rhodospirillaceae bacterium TMED8]|nr:D-glycerate dehydrogenase [Magnetovibrio sp.]OUT53382.1 MAG: D-glycerate dehydrogenase [Rhodospirillaceae bacterium TMED8]|tara:strand:+ start:486 stop:1457 length:972 start_codon:yes stop_codon:yes gene_type:complete
MKKPVLMLTRRWPEEVEINLLKHFEVVVNKDDIPLTQDALKEAFCSYDAVLTTVTDRIDDNVLSADKLRTKLIGNFGVGFNHIDIKAAKTLGVVVTNTPDVVTNATADLTLALLLAAARRLGAGERHLREGNWSGWRPTHMLGRDFSGRTLGIVGFGRIGQATARRAHHGFGMKIKIYSRSPVPSEILSLTNSEQLPCLDTLLSSVDFVSLHCPANNENTHMINLNRLRKMKPTAFLVNTARGSLVNEKDLVTALDSGLIAGAGLDVFEAEPRIYPGLMKRRDVVLLPHLGSATIETRNAMGLRVLENALAFFSGRQPPDRVV